MYPLPVDEIPKNISTYLSPFFPLPHSGLYPEDALEAAFADAAVDAVADNHTRLAPTVQEKDQDKKVRFRSAESAYHVHLWVVTQRLPINHGMVRTLMLWNCSTGSINCSVTTVVVPQYSTVAIVVL